VANHRDRSVPSSCTGLYGEEQKIAFDELTEIIFFVWDSLAVVNSGLKIGRLVLTDSETYSDTALADI